MKSFTIRLIAALAAFAVALSCEPEPEPDGEVESLSDYGTRSLTGNTLMQVLQTVLKEVYDMKRIFLIFFILMTSALIGAGNSALRTQGNAVQLIVDGKPFIVLGGELGNSSAACAEDIEVNFAKLHRMGLNTVLVPAYWDLLEPVQGQFDFSTSRTRKGLSRTEIS